MDVFASFTALLIMHFQIHNMQQKLNALSRGRHWMTDVCLLIYFAANRGTQCSTQVRTRCSVMALRPDIKHSFTLWCNPLRAITHQMFSGSLYHSNELFVQLLKHHKAKYTVCSLICFLHTMVPWALLYLILCLKYNHSFSNQSNLSISTSPHPYFHSSFLSNTLFSVFLHLLS